MKETFSFEEVAKEVGVSVDRLIEVAKKEGLIDDYNHPTVKGAERELLTMNAPNLVIDGMEASIVFLKSGMNWKETALNPNTESNNPELMIYHKKEVMSLTLDEIQNLKKFLNTNF